MSNVIPAAALNQHIVALGKTGSGKSSALRFIVEHYLVERNKRVCIIDPKGDWWGIKVAADGKGPGLPFILFGDFKNPAAKDVPINDRSGKQIAELISDGNRPCVIGLRGWTQGAMTRFWIDFASTLFAKNSGELYLVGDEFHNFAPKQWKGQADKDTPVGVGLHWANRLLSEGRGLGLVCLIASQRPQKVHNDTLTSCETLLAMRVVHKADREAVKAWIDGNGDPELGKTVLGSLAAMPRGDAWAWSPEIGFGPKQVTFPMFGTFDSFAPPQLQKRVSDKGWADVDLSEVKSALADAVKEAEANDPKILRREIAELKKQVAAKPAPAADPKAIEKAVASALSSRDREWQKAIKERDGIIGDLKGRIGKAASILNVNGEATPKAELPIGIISHVPAQAKPAKAFTSPLPRQPVKSDRNYSQNHTGGDIPKGEAAVLSALIQFPDGRTREQLTVLTGYKRSSRDAYLQRLREKGLVDCRSDLITATQEGIAALPDAEPLPTGTELQDYWLRRLPEGERKLLQELIEAYPDSVNRETLGESAGYKRSSRDAYLQRMRAKQLIEEPGRGEVRASENLF